MDMKLSADRELCIAAGNCVMVAGEFFDQDDDGIVVVLTEDVPGRAGDTRGKRSRSVRRRCCT